MSEQNKLGASKHSTRRNGLRYWKQSEEGQITQPCYAVSYLSHREPKALCTAHLTQHSPGLGPGGGGRTALQQHSAWDTRAFPNAPRTALHSSGHLQVICVGCVPIGVWPF